MIEFVQLTEMWRDHKYVEVGEYIQSTNWSKRRLAQFCAYFCKYLGNNQLNILYKFI